MSTIDLGALLDLPRPEYAKQTELILVDMLWRSEGGLAGTAKLFNALSADSAPGAISRRLVLSRLDNGPKARLVTQTREWANGIAWENTFADEQSARLLISALLMSCRAPLSRQFKSVTCSPLHAGLFPYQTLAGATNKASPANLARAVDQIAKLGGASINGAPSALLAHALCSPEGTDTHWLDSAFDALGQAAWVHILDAASTNLRWRPLEPLPNQWPRAHATIPLADALNTEASSCRTPFTWFWDNWRCLFDPASGWRSALPDRRFLDWAVTIARTGLAMSYIWEAQFFRNLFAFLMRPEEITASWAKLQHLAVSPALVRLESLNTKPSDKDISGWLDIILSDGFQRRREILSCKNTWFPAVSCIDLTMDEESARLALQPVAEALIADRASSNEITADGTDFFEAPSTIVEFVRYAMQPRSSDDDTHDQADLYYLARSNNRRQLWIEPGPEWLVVISSLIAGKPGGACTLGDIRRGLGSLGVMVERTTLVRLLEMAGLTQDSPDADDAVIVNSGF